MLERIKKKGKWNLATQDDIEIKKTFFKQKVHILCLEVAKNIIKTLQVILELLQFCYERGKKINQSHHCLHHSIIYLHFSSLECSTYSLFQMFYLIKFFQSHQNSFSTVPTLLNANC